MSDATITPPMIVGVGASAGGLNAFEAFLRGIPGGDAFGYVLVQHLDPTHESELPGILQRVTPVDVRHVTEGMSVEPGEIYVIPSGKFLTIEDGVLHLGFPDDSTSVRTPIDTFLRSLAHDQGANAACVILSGTGTDGALGLKAVKENGGICLVQDPDEAQYDGMPRAALATDLVDVVAPAGELGERLAAYRRMSPALPVDTADDTDADREEKMLVDVFSVVQTHTGLDFSSYKEATIWRRVRHRMQLQEVDTLADYLERLATTPEEAWTLAREFLISVTNFFRDREAFEALSGRCIPHLFAEKTDSDTIRVWVPGCATGEEAYSLLMLLMEHRSTSSHKPSIQLFATDIDKKALDHAQTGFYPPSIRADVSEERLRQFFTREDGGYRVRPELRESILFAEHNLLADPPFSDLDLVSCRNVLIYLKPEMQAKVLMMFHYALKEQKYLFLGQSETPTAKDDLYAKMENAPHLYRVRDRTADYPYPLVPGSRPTTTLQRVPPTAEPSHGSLQVLHRRLVTERFVPPSVLVDDALQIVHMIGEVGAYLQLQAGPPSNRIVDVAPKALRGELRAALFTAFNREETAVLHYVPDDTEDTRGDDERVKVTIEPVSPETIATDIPPTTEAFALVTFEEATGARPPSTNGAPTAAAEEGDEAAVANDQRLKRDLIRTRHRLEVVTEEYETSNEELLASNEELQSANEELRSTMEELQTSREELQSANEELVTVNQELKAKIQALNQRNSDVQNLMEATDVGTLFLNHELELRRYTARATDLFHIIPADIGRPLAHLTHEITDADPAALVKQVLKTQTPLTRELQSTTGDWFKLRVLPYRTVEEAVEGVLITFFEVTDLKEAEARVEQMNTELEARVESRTEELEAANMKLQAQMDEVQRAQRHFQKLFRLGPVAGVITTLETGEIQNVNQRYTELTGYSREALVGNTLVGLGILSEADSERLRGILRDEGALRYDEVPITTKDGQTLQMMVSNEVIDQEEGPTVLSLGVNITARKQAEEALRQAKQEAEEMNQLKTSFIANMSHEIRTPLTGIIGFAEILEEEVEDDETERHVHYIRTNGRRLLETLDSVLDLARLDAEQIHLDPTPVSLPAFAEETMALFRQRAVDKGIALTMEVDEDLPQVRIDESALQRMLTNLIGNALKFTEEGRVTLSISAESAEALGEEQGTLRFEVRDTGIGMESDFQERLFREFTQEQTGMRRTHEGAGLGLAITHRLVGLMDGTIEVESAPDVGTTFRIRIPYDPVLDLEAGPVDVSTHWQTGDWGPGSRRVLVVDDRPEVGVIVEQFLDDCEVVAVVSASDALATAAEEPFDLALVDIQLGDSTSGMDVLPELQQHLHAPNRGAPVIAMTAHSLPGDRQRFLDAGFDHYLSKPFTRTGLRTAIAQVLPSADPSS